MLKKALFIAEKPSERRAVEECYKRHKNEIPYEITFVEQRGHLMRLLMPDEMDESLKEWSWDTLPYRAEDYGGFKYTPIKEKASSFGMTSQERLKKIKQTYDGGDFDVIIHAGDADQEGELLVRETLKYLKNRLPVLRFWANDTVEENILKALKNLGDDDHDDRYVNLYAASLGRQHSDQRIGVNLSRAASLKLGARVAIGRVKTPIMSLVCRREEEIKNFVPETVYGVSASYSDGFAGQLFVSTAEAKEEDKEKEKDEESELVWYKDKSDAENVISTLGNKAVVRECKTEKKSTLPPKLFKLATAQAALGKYGFSAQKTLDVIQVLYERGYLSYPRTDGEYLSSGENLNAMIKSASSIPKLKSYTDSINSTMIGKVKSTKKWINDEKTKESGHTALVPTTKKPDFESFTDDEKKVYTTICKRFVSIFLPPMIQNKTTLITEVDGNFFRTTGTVLVDPGFSKLYDKKFEDNQIPTYKAGDVLTVDEYTIPEKTSTCPSRFTDATLNLACEAPQKYLEDKNLRSLGKALMIGRPSTRGGIIEDLIRVDKYLKRDKKNIVPTEAGMKIYHALKGREITRVDMTGEWEIDLESIRRGQMSLDEFEQKMISDVDRMVKEIKEADMRPIGKTHQSKEIGTCPKCGGKLYSGEKSYYCGNWKSSGCKVGCFKTVGGAEITEEEFFNLLDGQHIKKKMTIAGRQVSRGVYLDTNTGKLNFESSATEYNCPKCGQRMTDDGVAIVCLCGLKIWKAACGVEFTEEQIENIIKKGDSGLIKGLKSSKTGKIFDAHIVLSEDKTKTKFKFEESEDVKVSKYKCPKCGKNMKDDGRILSCECNCKIWKSSCGVNLSEEQLQNLFENGDTGLIEGLVSPKSGKEFSAHIVLKKDKTGTEFKFDDYGTGNGTKSNTYKSGKNSSGGRSASSSGSIELNCPNCGESLTDDGRTITCKCGLKIWKTAPGGKPLTKTQLTNLVTKGDTGLIKGLKSKKGKLFDAHIVLKADLTGTELKFE